MESSLSVSPVVPPEIVAFADAEMASTALLDFVRALARKQARIDHMLSDGSDTNGHTKH